MNLSRYGPISQLNGTLKRTEILHHQWSLFTQTKKSSGNVLKNITRGMPPLLLAQMVPDVQFVLATFRFLV